jgi:outer membrane protein OmpA-like peptidoglycan-associated protein
MNLKLAYRLSAIGLLLLLGAFYGCAGREYAPNRGVMYYHKELPAADRAVEAARAAGKDKGCPAEFAAAEKMKNDAYDIYLSCRTAEGIAMANAAAARANALCPRVEVTPLPPPAAPTVSISADPATIEQGQCAMLVWSTTGASSATIDQGIGSVDLSGSRQVCPVSTTEYTITAMGEGGTRTTSTTVTVPGTAPVPAPKAEVKFILLEEEHFDFDKSSLTEKGVAIMERNILVFKENPKMTVRIAGYASASGTEEYNQKLSERRAKTVQDYLIKEGGIAPGRLTTIGYGENRPATYEPIPSDINSKAAKSNMRVLFEIIVK